MSRDEFIGCLIKMAFEPPKRLTFAERIDQAIFDSLPFMGYR